MIDKAFLELELMDCRAQRDQAQQQLTQANQIAQTASINITGCSFVERQLLALIAKEEKDLADEIARTTPSVAVPKSRRVRRKRIEPSS